MKRVSQKDIEDYIDAMRSVHVESDALDMIFSNQPIRRAEKTNIEENPDNRGNV